MKKSKQKYTKPKVIEKKVEINFFNSNSRIFDSFDELLAPNVFAQSCCGCGGGCFLPGTNILMADGSYKQIEHIKEGDKVTSFNVTEGNMHINTVSDTVIYHDLPTGHLIINGRIKVTGYHKIWVNNKEWKRADTLHAGDTLTDEKGERIIVNSIDKVPGSFDVYNFELQEKSHNYFADNILVHNGPYS